MKRWDEMIKRLPEDTPVTGVEIGVFRGGLSFVLLTKLPQLTLYMVDPWEVYGARVKRDHTPKHLKHTQTELDRFHDEVTRAAERFGDRAQVIREYSLKAFQEFEDAALDFVYIDGEHTYPAVKADIRAWGPKVKPGGWIAGHSYGKRTGVTRAVEELLGDVERGVEDTFFYRVPCTGIVGP